MNLRGWRYGVFKEEIPSDRRRYCEKSRESNRKEKQKMKRIKAKLTKAGHFELFE